MGKRLNDVNWFSDSVILCDLGGVLIDLHWERSVNNLLGTKLTRQQLLERWMSLSSIKTFEAGLCSFADFFSTFCQETMVRMDLEEFSKEFLSIIGPIKPGCFEILQRLKKNYRLALLSNTNAMHIEFLRKQTSLLDYFDQLFLSYEMHLLKPDPAIFKQVAKQLVIEPTKILFFDDSKINVEAALKAGFKAFQVESPEAIAEIVEKLSF